MHIIAEEIARYAENHTSPEDPILHSLNRQTHLKALMPQMLSGHLQGAFLKMVSQMVQPSRILEIGTFTGYSAICLCAGLKPNGLLHTIDINEELAPIQQHHFKAAQLEKQIIQHTGNALDIIPMIDETFDLVFIDADKLNYENYYHLVFSKVRQNGFILADNVLWSGKVLHNNKDKDTEALHRFNQMVQNDPRVENLLLPLRDGMMLIRKR
ncbi:MAG TPA: O-methyltransferase [Chitinophagales bacterium]|nr:O-methyltransferase [Chitinophagales bacterium]HRK26829.1 O-methyltransferase [Chitinophagales bacterium]